MSMETTKTASHGVVLTSNAAAKVKNLLAQEDRDDYRLRIAVDSGGCSGLKYQLFFDERVEEGDAIVEFDGVGLIVDRKSVPYLEGATIDFHDSIEKQGFDIDNPNATNSCACGESFS
jgi:iron-sulfur cluster assembly accessory protein